MGSAMCPHVFLFLSNVMDLLMRKRFTKMLDSFNDNIYKKFEDDIQKINAKASEIRTIVSQSSRAEVRHTRVQLEQLDRDLRVGLQGDARHRAEMQGYASRIEKRLHQAQIERQELIEAGRQFKELTWRLGFMLEQQGQASLSDRRAELAASRRLIDFPQANLLMAHSHTLQTTEYLSDDVARNSMHLEAFFDRDRVRIPYDRLTPVRVPRQTLSRLTEWSADVTSKMLFIEGPPTAADGIYNPLSRLAATFIDLASQSGFPVMSYFCELPRRHQLRPDSDEPAVMQGVISLFSALLRQMVELVLPIFETQIDLSEARFRMLNGTTREWDEAMALFRDLAKLMPQNMFCVIDGLHWFDDKSVEKYLAGLVQVLRESKFKGDVCTTEEDEIDYGNDGEGGENGEGGPFILADIPGWNLKRHIIARITHFGSSSKHSALSWARFTLQRPVHIMPLPLQDIYAKEEVAGYVFEQNVTIPRKTGIFQGGILRANVYRPHGSEQYPVILTLGPYGKDWHYSTFNKGSFAAVNPNQKDAHSAWETPSPSYWTAHGYVVVRVDEGGIGQSPGVENVTSKESIDGFFDSIEWAAEQPWSSGKVGLLGLSYYALTQWYVAARHPKGLSAMIPWEGLSDVYRESSRHGGIASSGFLNWWWNNSLRGNQYGYATPEEKAGRPKTLEGVLPEEELAANRTVVYDAVAENEFIDSPYYSAQKGFKLEDITTPLLSVANWGGIGLHLRGNVVGFAHVSSQFKYMRFIVGRHDLPFYYEEEVENQRSFLDAFLKVDDTKGWATPGKVPPIDMVIRKGEPEVGNAAQEADIFKRRPEYEWPLARTKYERFYLTEGSGLSLKPAQGSRFFEYNAPSGGSIEFSTGRFENDIEITGHSVLHLTVSLAALDGFSPSDMDVFVTLRHFNASGKEVLYTGSFSEPCPITRGWLRASHRAIDASSSVNKPYLPVHLHTAASARPVAADGTLYELDIELWPTNVVIAKGGRLVLEIAACDNPEGSSHPPVGVWTHDDVRDRPEKKFKGINRVHSPSKGKDTRKPSVAKASLRTPAKDGHSVMGEADEDVPVAQMDNGYTLPTPASGQSSSRSRSRVRGRVDAAEFDDDEEYEEDEGAVLLHDILDDHEDQRRPPKKKD
ncbi:hypothetical protein AK830_g11574 [Neonectria ditissima]|uniref:Xaa-Pro dipeptidyl-peptidase C-terminal domain-containing protein n=1 Tax=Neonectria ditissima TaxID=78410 RepID=A0A0P7AM01_9HYPO|nr:hypothetical protein AK830_g11574 [Neonectria ditissima]